MSDALFDVETIPKGEQRHPLNGMPLLDNGETCGTCAWKSYQQGGSRWYWKCLKFRVAHSSATDLRLKWPACTLWEAAS